MVTDPEPANRLVLDYKQTFRAKATAEEGRIVLRREGPASAPFYLSQVEAFALIRFIQGVYFYASDVPTRDLNTSRRTREDA